MKKRWNKEEGEKEKIDEKEEKPWISNWLTF